MPSFGKDKMKEIWVGSDLSMRLGEAAPKIRETLKGFEKTDPASRIWRKDPTFWVADKAKAQGTSELIDRLGWLDSPHRMLKEVDKLRSFALSIKDEGFKDAVLLGMGGSSLAPEVFMRTFGNIGGYPALTVLDSTNPDQIRTVEKKLDLERTLFIVSSKSGSTLETMSLFKYFYHTVSLTVESPGKNFVAITDPGSSLEVLAKERRFRKVFHGDPEVGGRYSALTNFGLLPAALIGVDIEKMLLKARDMAQETKGSYSTIENPGVALGAALGELALMGKDKITFFASGSVSSFAMWVEQLIAESTGKKGKGMLPVVFEHIQTKQYYGKDRVFVCINLKGENDEEAANKLSELENAGFPIIRIYLDEKEDIGREFYRWEMATAVAGKILNINPFDQPDVELAKKKAKQLMKEYESTGEVPSSKVLISKNGVELGSTLRLKSKSIEESLCEYLDMAKEGDYIAIMAYLPYDELLESHLGELRSRIHKKTKLATTLGFGPRFLHSTGQLHKGDNNNGLFIQITAKCKDDVSVPGEPYSFGTVLSAQAEGDYLALQGRERRILRLHFSDISAESLKKLIIR